MEIGGYDQPQTPDEPGPGQVCGETADWIADAVEKAVLGGAWQVLTYWDSAPCPRDP